MATVAGGRIVVPYRTGYAFQGDAFQNDAFLASDVTDFAFQQCAFQYDGFQADICGDPPPETGYTDYVIFARRCVRR